MWDLDGKFRMEVILHTKQGQTLFTKEQKFCYFLEKSYDMNMFMYFLMTYKLKIENEASGKDTVQI